MRLSPLLLIVALSSSAAQTEFNPGDAREAPVFEALVRAYPDWVSQKIGDDHLVTVNGKDFTWAEGRLLSPGAASNWESYAAQPFYPYPRGEPDVSSWTDEKIASTEARLASRRNTAPRRSSDFFDTLWGIRNEADADGNQRKVQFLGFKLTVHNAVTAPLSRVEARLSALRATDPTLDTFIKSLSHLEGFNWRDIAETQSRSNHAYGIAIDLIPRSYNGLIPYWLWAPQEKPGWYRKAWIHRWQPHPAVVEAFEAEGFVWGGKWLLFDTIHFEYRPEILELNGLR